MALGTQTRPAESHTLDTIFETEQLLVGLILAEPAVYGQVSAILVGADWTQPLHRGVFEVAGSLIERGDRVALHAIASRVSDVGPDGATAERYLAMLVDRAPAATRAGPLASLLAEAARGRPAAEENLHNRDPYAWAYEQAQRLRRGQWSSLDALNLAEEIEDLGSEIYSKLESALRITLMHLLKWDHQPERRSRNWALSIRNGRLDAEDLLERYPGVRGRLTQAVSRAYRRARIDAAGETGLDERALPTDCPYTYETIMTRPVAWPAAQEDASSSR